MAGVQMCVGYKMMSFLLLFHFYLLSKCEDYLYCDFINLHIFEMNLNSSYLGTLIKEQLMFVQG